MAFGTLILMETTYFDSRKPNTKYKTKHQNSILWFRVNKAFVFVFVLFALTASCIITIKPARASADSWIERAPMPFAYGCFGVATVNGKIYAIGGSGISYPLSHNFEYDPATNSWTSKTNMPTPRHSFGIAVWQNKIYVIGGRTNNGLTGVNEVYDPATDTWENKTPMPTPRFYVVANSVEDKIYVIGGKPGVKSGLVKVNEVYDPATDTWETKAPMPNSDSLYDSAVVDNKIYVIGTLTQIYDPETDTWSLGTPPPTPAQCGAVGATTGLWAPKRIYLLGGTLNHNTTDINQIYNPEDNTWTEGTPMPHDRTGLALAVVNDTVYALGGEHREWYSTHFNYNHVAFNEQYTPMGYIPEFPSWTPMLITLVAVVFVAVIYRHRLHKQNQKRF